MVVMATLIMGRYGRFVHLSLNSFDNVNRRFVSTFSNQQVDASFFFDLFPFCHLGNSLQIGRIIFVPCYRRFVLQELNRLHFYFPLHKLIYIVRILHDHSILY